MAQRLLREGGRGHPHQDDRRLPTRYYPRRGPTVRLSSLSRGLQTTSIKGYPWDFIKGCPGCSGALRRPLSGLRFAATQRRLEIPSNTGAPEGPESPVAQKGSEKRKTPIWTVDFS
jgi:hypothetical protein